MGELGRSRVGTFFVACCRQEKGSGGLGNYARIYCPVGYSHFIDKCVQLDSSLPSANYDSAFQACNTVDTVIFQPRGYLIASALGKTLPSTKLV